MPRLLPERFSPVAQGQGPIAVPAELPVFSLQGAALFPRVPVTMLVPRSAWELARPEPEEDPIIGVLAETDSVGPRRDERLAFFGVLVHPDPGVIGFARSVVKTGCAARVLGESRFSDEWVELLVRGGPQITRERKQAEVSLTLAVRSEREDDAPRADLPPESRRALTEVADAVLSAFLGERTVARDWVDRLRSAHDLAAACLYALELEVGELQKLLLAGPEARLARALTELVTGERAVRKREAAMDRLRETPGFPR